MKKHGRRSVYFTSILGALRGDSSGTAHLYLVLNVSLTGAHRIPNPPPPTRRVLASARSCTAKNSVDVLLPPLDAAVKIRSVEPPGFATVGANDPNVTPVSPISERRIRHAQVSRGRRRVEETHAGTVHEDVN